MPSRYNPDKHHRRSIRLKGYDYTAAGAYFITLCAYQRECLFGEIEAGEMRLSVLGEVVRSHWMKLPQYHPQLQLDEFIVMPNHFHGILILVDNGRVARMGDQKPETDIADDVLNARQDCVRAGLAGSLSDMTPNLSAKPAPTCDATRLKRHSISEIVRGFKTFSARRINQIRRTPSVPVWQRNYYEHIIRNDRALQHIRQYIQNNALSWQEDQLHPENPSKW